MPAKTVKTYKHAAHLAWRKVDGEAVILDVDTAVYYSLGGVGLRIWEMVGKKAPAAKIVKTLSDEYDADPKRIARDVEAILKKLKKEAMIEPA